MKQSLSKFERDELALVTLNRQALNGRDLLYALLIFFAFGLVFVPKIYLSSQIYYLSRDILRLENNLELLDEENKNLKKELENFKFEQILRIENF